MTKKCVKVVSVKDEQTVIVDCHDVYKTMIKTDCNEYRKPKVSKVKEIKVSKTRKSLKVSKKNETFHNTITQKRIISEKTVIIQGKPVHFTIRAADKQIKKKSLPVHKKINKNTGNVYKISNMFHTNFLPEDHPDANYIFSLKDVPIPAGDPAKLIFELNLIIVPMGITWRRIQIRGKNTFFDLHLVIQKVMCWGDLNKHIFLAQNPCTEIYNNIMPPEDIPHSECKVPIDETKALISNYFPNKNRVFYYYYSMDDPWIVCIKLENILPPDDYPKFITGEGVSPTDAFGGPLNYRKNLRKMPKGFDIYSPISNRKKNNYYGCVRTENQFKFKIIPKASPLYGKAIDMPLLD